MHIKINTLEQKYGLLEKKIKEEMLLSVNSGEIDEAELMVFLKIFSNVENYWELRLFMRVFEGQFVFLKRANEMVREIQKSEVEIFLESKLQEVLKTNPDLVMKITKYASSPKANLVELFEKFKELKK